MKSRKTHIQGSSTARTILLISTAISFVMSHVFHWNPGLQFPLTVLLLVSAYLYLLTQSKRQLSRYHTVLLSFAILLSGFVAVRDASYLYALSVFATGFLLGIVALETIHPKPLSLRSYLIGVWMLPLTSIRHVVATYVQADVRTLGRLNKTHASIIRGILFALPALLLFGLLFASADAVFADIFSNLFDVQIRIAPETFGRLVAWTAFFLGLCGVFGRIFLYKTKKFKEEKPKHLQESHRIELLIFLGSLNALFLSFILIQSVYLFGGHDTVLNGNLTYAEYGREGFIQLLCVSALVYALSFAVKKYTALHTHKQSRLLLYGLIVQVGVIMASALKRLSLYEDAYGFTITRFNGHVFIFFLAAVFACLVYAIYKNRSESFVLRTVVIACASYVLLLNVLNPEAVIAQMNIDRYKQGKEIDAYYLMYFSGNAIDQKLELARIRAEEGFAKIADRPDEVLIDTYIGQVCRIPLQTHWSEWNYGREKARAALNEADDLCDNEHINNYSKLHGYSNYSN